MNRTKLIVVIIFSLALSLFAVPAWADSTNDVSVSAPGNFSFEKAGFSMEVPPGVVTVMMKVRAEDSTSFTPLDDFYVLRPLNIYVSNNVGQPITLLKPVRLSYSFNELDFKRASNLKTSLSVGHFRIGYWDKVNQTWVQLPSRVYWNGSEGVVEAETHQGAGVYALLWNYQDNAALSEIADEQIRVMVDYSVVGAEAAPYIVDGRTMVPLRVVAEGLGAMVYWNSVEKRIDISKGTDAIKIWVGRSDAIKNNLPLADMDVPPEVVSGRSFVPLRFIAESLGAKVSWDQMTHTVKIQSK